MVPPSPLASYFTFMASSFAVTCAAARGSRPEYRIVFGGSEITPATYKKNAVRTAATPAMTPNRAGPLPLRNSAMHALLLGHREERRGRVNIAASARVDEDQNTRAANRGGGLRLLLGLAFAIHHSLTSCGTAAHGLRAGLQGHGDRSRAAMQETLRRSAYNGGTHRRGSTVRRARQQRLRPCGGSPNASFPEAEGRRESQRAASRTGVVAIARRPPFDLAAVAADPAPAPVVLLEDPRTMGNLGACVRVSAAAGAAALLTTGPNDPGTRTHCAGRRGFTSRCRSPPSPSRRRGARSSRSTREGEDFHIAGQCPSARSSPSAPSATA